MTTIPPAPNQFQVELEPEPPQWPKVIGIISIIWGSFAVLCNVCGLLQGMFGNMMQGQGGGQPGMPQFQAPPPTLAMLVTQVLSTLIGVVLLIAGVMTLKRRPVGRPLHLGYAACSIVVGLVGTVVSWDYTQTMLQAMEQQMAADPKTAAQASQIMGMARMFSIFGIVIGVIISMAYPIFCLIWFGAVKKSAAELTLGADHDPI